MSSADPTYVPTEGRADFAANYKFRTGAAGNYIVNVTSTSGSGNKDVAYKFKKGTSCSSSSWTCAGSRGTSGSITMSNLSANSDYLLMLDAESEEGNSFSHTFRIDCPDPCGWHSQQQSLV